MIETHCPNCGGLFRLDDRMAGKRFRCSRCKQTVSVPAIDPLAPDTREVTLIDEDELPPPGPPPAPPGSKDAPLILNHAAKETRASTVGRGELDYSTGPTRAFWADAGWAFATPFRGRGPFVLGILTFLAVAYCLLGWASIFGLIGQACISGFVCAYSFNLIQTTCNGEDEPPPMVLENLVDDMVIPYFHFLGAALWAATPALVWFSAMLWKGPFLPGLGDTAVLIGLGVMGVFIWPMTILTIALNGLSINTLRYDLQLLTIGRSFPAYLAICTLLATTVVLTGAAGFGARSLATTTNLSVGAWLGATGLLAAAQAYMCIVSMRLIGLFYRHNKRRFAWQAE